MRNKGFVTFSPGFGQGSAAEQVQEQSPPSSYAVASMLDGERGAWVRLMGLTLLRGCFIIPGLWVASKLLRIYLEPMQLLGLSFAGSATISGGMVGYYAIRKALG